MLLKFKKKSAVYTDTAGNHTTDSSSTATSTNASIIQRDTRIGKARTLMALRTSGVSPSDACQNLTEYPKTFLFYLKECEFRYNRKHDMV